ncbi:hypothetical protein LINPERHAP2_LOCUS29018 [Linum perenne]
MTIPPPSYLEILEYLRCYDALFDLLKYVEFNAKVVEINYVNGDQCQTTAFTQYGDLLSERSMWKVTVINNDSDLMHAPKESHAQ